MIGLTSWLLTTAYASNANLKVALQVVFGLLQELHCFCLAHDATMQPPLRSPPMVYRCPITLVYGRMVGVQADPC